MLTFTKNGPASYSTAEPVAAAAWLVEQGYRAEDARSSYEYIRLRKAKSLIVLYHNGTVLLQGADTTAPRQLFEALNVPLPF